QGSLGDAAAVCEEAVKLAAALPAEAEQFKELARQLWLQDALTNAEKAEKAALTEVEKSQYCENAIKFYERAMQFCKTAECEPIRGKGNNIAFICTLNQIKKDFKNARTRSQELLEQLNRAKELLEKNSETATAEKRKELESLLARSQFYQILSRAGEAYSKGDYVSAVSAYRQALALLKDKRSLFEEAELSNEDKVSRTVTMIEISVDLNAAAAAEQQNNLTAALRHYQEVQSLIRTLGVINDERLLSLSRDVSEKISSLSSTADMKRKMDWLNRNFKRIFMEAYPASRAVDLKNPGLSLLRKAGSREIYKLTCSERVYQLELTYLYDPTADQWTSYRSDQ
ncbi:hypothetical protein VU06_03935, partial [Desulfobulbus sp. F3]|nr:hypothetical protein [Desulfobulbus sp. F3]